jgi:hypothetical protein
MAFEVDAAGEHDVGGRDHDKDAMTVRSDFGLFAVADGARGENAGHVASALALAASARQGAQIASVHCRDTPGRLRSARALRLRPPAFGTASTVLITLAKAAPARDNVGVDVVVADAAPPPPMDDVTPSRLALASASALASPPVPASASASALASPPVPASASASALASPPAPSLRPRSSDSEVGPTIVGDDDE